MPTLVAVNKGFTSTRLRGGFIAFTSLIIIAAVALSITVSVSLLGIGEAKSSLDFKKGTETIIAANGCLEEAMLLLRDSSTYAGGNLTMGDANCTITVSGSGSDRTINVQATINIPVIYTRRVQAQVKRTGNSLAIVSYSEVE